jgi:hypothetical protein
MEFWNCGKLINRGPKETMGGGKSGFSSVTKYLKETTYKRKVYFAHGFRSFSS